ncbi:MAG: hypothetical protein KBG60_01090 [Anaerolineaceae bacterium]|nr:hypothetical protein [Anaerolineaceae bacterium]
MQALPEPIQVTLKVVAVFNRLGISYFIGGSLASAVYGMARATMDADLVADIHPSQVPALVSALEGEFFTDAEMIQDAVEHVSSFNLIHLETMFKVDVFILKQHPFDQNQMERRISQVIGERPGEEAFFSTAEDIILAKLVWYRAGGEASERQWRDVMGVLNLQGDRLDFEYLQNWAGMLGVQDILRKALTAQGDS